jgi:hypothetical protein
LVDSDSSQESKEEEYSGMPAKEVNEHMAKKVDEKHGRKGG